MRHLVELELEGNQLEDFFSDVNIRLDSLQYLNLNQNKLSFIPESIPKMPRLSTLHIAINQLVDVRVLCNPSMRHLQVLDVSNNRIHEIPWALPYFLEDLNFLNVQNNEITKLPHMLGLHTKLKSLQVGGNPLK